MPDLAKELDAIAVVTDMCPLRDPLRWAHEVSEELAEAGDGTPLFQVCLETNRRELFTAFVVAMKVECSSGFIFLYTSCLPDVGETHSVVAFTRRYRSPDSTRC